MFMVECDQYRGELKGLLSNGMDTDKYLMSEPDGGSLASFSPFHCCAREELSQLVRSPAAGMAFMTVLTQASF